MKFERLTEVLGRMGFKGLRHLSEDEKEESLSEWKQSVLADFRQWLEDVNEELLDDFSDSDEKSGGELLELIGETTALRQEVKMMGRSSGKLLGAVEDVASTVSDTVMPLVDEFHRYDRDARVANERNVLRPLLLEFGDLAESVNEALNHFSEPDWPWYVPRRVRNITDTQQHRALFETLAVRCDSVLQRYDVKTVADIGDVFDSSVMTAVDRSEDGVVCPGEISLVVKQGFTVAGEVLRTAQVIVEKE